jgi:hypothetical protein
MINAQVARGHLARPGTPRRESTVNLGSWGISGGETAVVRIRGPSGVRYAP